MSTDTQPAADTQPRPDAPTGQPDTGEQPPPVASAPEATGTKFARIPVTDLATHPGNVRENLKLTKSFINGISARGIRQPLVVNQHPDGRLEIVIGHRRFAGAVAAGLTDVPCMVENAVGKHAADDYLDMHTENTEREALSTLEDARALFGAHQAGYSKTKIAKQTGLKPDQVGAALGAATVSDDAIELVGDLQLDMDWWALVAEFDGDPAAIRRIKEGRRMGHGVDYTAERARKDRADQQEQNRIRAALEEDGYTVDPAGTSPPGNQLLSLLAHDGENLTAETHTECPGRAVYFRSYEPTNPVHYCADPDKHGHNLREPGLGSGIGQTTLPAKKKSGLPLRLVKEGNAAWPAAAIARHKFLAQLVDRKTPPKVIDPYVTEELLAMPEPLCKWLGGAARTTLFTDLMHVKGHIWTREHAEKVVTTSTDKRRPLLRFAVIAAAYEYGLTRAGESKHTWREDQWSPMTSKDAGRYLRVLRAAGHTLAPIETALADGTPYTGDNPDDPTTSEAAEEETGEEETGEEETDGDTPDETADDEPADPDDLTDPDTEEHRTVQAA